MSLATADPARWRPLNARQRRVIGVLVEKAKTTPDAYPMTMNSIVTASNQKTNRHPLSDFSSEDVEQALQELREMGAVVEIVGSGRVPKYKHLMYEWLGVDKFELAVMTELLLRGEQTVGELRGRAARMEPIADLAALKPILASLIEKRLVIALTPEGRGQMVTHALYHERDLNELQARAAAGGFDVPEPPASDRASRPAAPSSPVVTLDMISELRVEVAELRAEVGRLRIQVRELEESQSRSG